MITRQRYVKLIYMLLVLLAAILSALLDACTYDRVTGLSAVGVTVSGTRLSILQRTSASFDRSTSGTLSISYNNDSQQAQQIAQQALALALAAGKAAAK